MRMVVAFFFADPPISLQRTSSRFCPWSPRPMIRCVSCLHTSTSSRRARLQRGVLEGPLTPSNLHLSRTAPPPAAFFLCLAYPNPPPPRGGGGVHACLFQDGRCLLLIGSGAGVGWGGLVVLRARAIFPHMFLCVGQSVSGWVPLELTPPPLL